MRESMNAHDAYSHRRASYLLYSDAAAHAVYATEWTGGAARYVWRDPATEAVYVTPEPEPRGAVLLAFTSGYPARIIEYVV